MKWCITLALLILCSSCVPAEKRAKAPQVQPGKEKIVTPYLRPDDVYTFRGTYYEGKGENNPQLVASRYLKTRDAGLAITQKGAGFYINVTVLQEMPKDSYVKVEFPDPNNPSVPYVNGITYMPGARGYKFSSPNTVRHLKMDTNYKITISVFKTKDSHEPIDVLVQEIRSYLDTTNTDRPITRPEYFHQK